MLSAFRKLPVWAIRFLLFCLLACVPVHAHEATAPAQKLIRVTLLQLNDVYQTAPVDKGTRGGLARVATLKKRIQAESPNTLLILAGDTLSPSVASRLFKGRQMIAAWNAMGLDYAALGNHEFDFGEDILKSRIGESKFTWMAANVKEKADKNHPAGKIFADMPRYIIRDFGGVKVGFFGLLTPDTINASFSKEAVFEDPIPVARQIVDELHAQGVHVIVAITHLNLFDDKELARAVPVDLILGGHEHTLLQSFAGKAPIFKVASDAVNLGRADLNLDPATGTVQSIDWQIIPVTSDIPDDPEIVAVTKKFDEQLSKELDQPAGKTMVVLDALQQNNRSRETNLGDFVTDLFRTETGADVALINGGMIRSNATYGPGVLSRRDVMAILPFENPVVKLQVTGAVIREALEHGVSRLSDVESGRFPQISGMCFSYDGSKPVGHRVMSITVGGEPLQDEKTYTLATTNFVMNGGDGYSMFKGAPNLIPTDSARIAPELFLEKVSDTKVLAPLTDGRIRRLDTP